MKKLQARWVLGLSLLTSLVGCGGSNAVEPAPTLMSNPRVETGETSLTVPVSCETAWTQYVSLHPVGMLLGYTTTKQTLGNSSDPIESSQSISEDLIQESTENHVLTLHRSTIEGLPQAVTTTTDLTRLQFVEGCKKLNGALLGLTLPASAQILEKSVQSLTVSAGTFSTNYVRGQVVDFELGTAMFQSWSSQDGSGIILKTVLETKTVVGDLTLTGVTATELTKLVKP